MIQLWQLKMSSPPKEQTLSWELLGWIKHSWDDYKKHYLEYKIGKIRMSTQKKKNPLESDSISHKLKDSHKTQI